MIHKSGERTNEMKKERVELHVHTKMSAMDGVTSAADFIRRAVLWGHPAIAITDHGAVQAFPEAMQAATKCRAQGQSIKILYGMEAYYVDDTAPENAAKTQPYHLTILAQNRIGLKNLYEFVSRSHLQDFHRYPCVTKSELMEHREGLLLGSGCAQGELYRAILDGKPTSALTNIAKLYDFLEIQPAGGQAVSAQDDLSACKEQVQAFNRTIIRLGETLQIPVCATGDVHFLDPEDEESYRVLMDAQDREAPCFPASRHFFSTKEMLEEFSYLGKETAYAVVVENPNRIADQIEDMDPIPEGSFYPHIDGAEEQLAALVRDRAHTLYGDPLPPIVGERLERELSIILENGYASLFWLSHLQIRHSQAQGYRAMARGTVGSSLVSRLAGISESDPLPPHYRCPQCRHTELFTCGEVGSGFDLPQKNCPVCGHAMARDGQDIPFESCFGLHGDEMPAFEINFSGEYIAQGEAKRYLESLFGKGQVIKAGAILTVNERGALWAVQQYAEKRDLAYPHKTLERLAKGLIGVKRASGQHPGSFFILPENREAEDFTPLQHPYDDPDAGISTHFDFFSLHNVLLRLGNFGYTGPTICRYLEKYTGIPVTDADVSDPTVYRLFTSPKPLGVTPEQIGCRTGTCALSAWGTPFAERLLVACQPKGFADLIKIFGLAHGTDVWTDNAQNLLEKGVCILPEVIGNREDIYMNLTRRGMERPAAYRIMEIVRKGQAGRLLTETEQNRMRACGIPEWYIDSCRKIKYLFPKAHAAEYVLMDVRLGWYKLYYPVAYYAAWLTARDDFVDQALVRGGAKTIAKAIQDLREPPAFLYDRDLRSTLQGILEAIQRGVRFLPADLYRSAASAFVPENGAIRLPLTSVKGVTLEQAQHIESARQDGALPAEELIAFGVPKEAAEVLEKQK